MAKSTIEDLERELQAFEAVEPCTVCKTLPPEVITVLNRNRWDPEKQTGMRRPRLCRWIKQRFDVTIAETTLRRHFERPCGQVTDAAKHP